MIAQDLIGGADEARTERGLQAVHFKQEGTASLREAVPSMYEDADWGSGEREDLIEAGRPICRMIFSA